MGNNIYYLGNNNNIRSTTIHFYQQQRAGVWRTALDNIPCSLWHGGRKACPGLLETCLDGGGAQHGGPGMQKVQYFLQGQITDSLQNTHYVMPYFNNHFKTISARIDSKHKMHLLYISYFVLTCLDCQIIFYIFSTFFFFL